MGEQRYLPVDEQELQSLLAGDEATAHPDAWVDTITLQASLNAQGELAGAGAMQVALADSAPSGFIAWPYRSMQLRNPRWIEPAVQRVTLGAWPVARNQAPPHLEPNSDEPQTLMEGFLAPASGEITFRFSLAPVEGSDPPRYVAPLPEALQRELTLRLPPGTTPVAIAGLVSKPTPAEKPGIEPGVAEAIAWRLRPHAGQPLSFLLVPDHEAKVQSPAIRASIETVASVQPGGVETVSLIALSSESELPETLVVTPAPTQSILEIAVDGKAADWRWEATGDGSERLAIDTARRRLSRGANLTIRSWTPLPERATWRLEPLTIPAAVLAEGSARVTASPEVSIVDVSDMVETRFRADDNSSPTSTQALGFQFLKRDAGVTLTFEFAADQLAMKLAHETEIGKAETRTVAAATAAEATTAVPLVFEVADGWSVDTVDATPPSALGDWAVEPTPKGQRLVVSLNNENANRAADPSSDEDGSVTIHVDARRATPANRRLLLSDLAPLRPVDAQVQTSRLTLSAEPAYELRLSPLAASLLAGDGVPEAADTPAIDDGTDAPLDSIDKRVQIDLLSLAASRKDAAPTVTLLPKPRRFDTAMKVEVGPGDSGISYRAEITVEGSASSPSVLVVAFSTPLPDNARWTNASTGETVDARREASSSLRSRLSPASERWVIQTPTSKEPLRIAVEAVRPALTATEAPLPYARFATSQRGVVLLRGFGVTHRKISGRGLTATPTTASNTLQYSYSPGSLLDFRRSTRLLLGPPHKADTITSLPNSPLRLEKLTTVCRPTDGPLHTARYAYRPGLRECRFWLPQGARLISVTSDAGAPLPVTRPTVGVDLLIPFVVTLPGADGADRWDVFAITYQLDSTSRAVAPALPETQADDGDWRWRVLTPRGWELHTATPRGWRERILGPFGRNAGDKPFNPFESDDWRRLGRALTSPSQTVNAVARRLDFAEVTPQAQTTLGIDASADADLTPSGWAAREFPGSSTPPAEVRLVDTTRRRFGVLATLVLTIGLSVCLLPRRPSRTTLTASGALVAALVAPDPLAPYASAVWGGVVFAWPFAWLCCRPPSAQRVASDGETSRRVASLTGIDPTPLAFLLAIPIGLMGAGSAVAQPTVIEPVLIPVDDDGESVGDKHYVRDAFLKRLIQQRETRRSAAPSDIVLLGMRVAGELVPGPAVDTLEARGWTLSLEFETLRSRVSLPLPFRQDQATWPELASLDGLPAALVWDRQGRCSIGIPESGRGVLRLAFRPRITVEDGRSAIGVQLPAVPNATVRLAYPASLTSLRVPLATDSHASEPGKLSTTLERDGNLQATWSSSPSADADAEASPIDALQWLRVSEQGVTADVQLVSNGKPRVVSIQTPTGWESLDAPGADVVEVVSRQRNGERPTDGEPTAVARFRLKRRSPLGQIEAPLITAVDTAFDRQHAAVSLGTGYRRGLADSPGVRPLEPTEFLAEWLSSDPPILNPIPATVPNEAGPPDFAVDLHASSRWDFRVEPASHPLENLNQRLAIAVTPDLLRMRLLISEFSKREPVLRLKTPDPFEVESIIVLGEQRSIRWTQPSPSRLVLFLPSALERGQLEVRGTAPRPSGAFPASTLSLVTPTPAPSATSFWRDERVRITVRDSDGSEFFSESATAAPAGWPYRHVATAPDSSSTGGWMIQGAANEPVYDLIAATTIQRNKAGLLLSWNADLTVRSGLLGEAPILLSIPPDRVAELRVVEPAGATLTASEITGDARRLRLATPIAPGGSVRLRLAISIDAGDEGSLTTPMVDFPEAQSFRRWLAVPRTLSGLQNGGEKGSQRRGEEADTASGYRWSAIGYRGASKPSEAAAPLLPSGDGWRLYTATESDSPSAADGRVFWSVSRGPRAKLRCLLAEHRLVAPHGIEPTLTSHYTLAPGGVSRCRISLGEGQRLRGATLDGVDAVVSNQGGGAWDIEFRSPAAPQLLRLTVAGPAGVKAFPPPRLSTARLGEVKPDATLWAVRNRSGYKVIAPATGWVTQSRAMSFARLRAYEAATASARSTNNDWLAVWRARLERTIAEARAEDDVGVFESPAPPSQNDERSIGAVLRRAQAWLDSQAGAVTPETPTPPPADLSSIAATEQWSYVIVNEAPLQATPAFAAVPTSDLSLRILLATAVVIGASATRRRIAEVDLAAMLYLYRHAFAAAGGVLWWLLFEPSVVGLLLLAASVAGQLRSLLRSDW